MSEVINIFHKLTREVISIAISPDISSIRRGKCPILDNLIIIYKEERDSQANTTLLITPLNCHHTTDLRLIDKNPHISNKHQGQE